MPNAKLCLDDGSVFEGEAFGSSRPVGGEVVFNTAMAGYVELLTDPSYRDRSSSDLSAYGQLRRTGPPGPGTSRGPTSPLEVQVQGLVVQNYVDTYSHPCRELAGNWLRGENIPAMTGVDTRTLTRRLREHGTMPGWLVTPT